MVMFSKQNEFLVPTTQNTGELLDFFSVNCEQTNDGMHLHCIDQLLKLYFSVWMLRLRQRFNDYEVVYQFSLKLNNKPFSRQVTSCVTLYQNHPVTHAVIVTARHVHSPQGLDPKGGQSLFLEFSTSHVTSPACLQEHKALWIKRLTSNWRWQWFSHKVVLILSTRKGGNLRRSGVPVMWCIQGIYFWWESFVTFKPRKQTLNIQ